MDVISKVALRKGCLAHGTLQKWTGNGASRNAGLHKVSTLHGCLPEFGMLDLTAWAIESASLP
jgi:hypothetical protein